MGWNYIRNNLFWIFIIFCLLLGGCLTFWKERLGYVECPPDEYCLDLTNKIFFDLLFWILQSLLFLTYLG